MIAALTISACAGYPEYKDEKKLECWTEQPFQSGRVNAVNGVMGNWINDARESSVNLIRRSRNFPDNTTMDVVTMFADPQPDFQTLEMRAGEKIVRVWPRKHIGFSDDTGEPTRVDGRPYYTLRLRLEEIYELSEGAEAVEMVAMDAGGIEAARERIDLSNMDAVIQAVEAEIDRSAQMYENRRQDCTYYHEMTMPVPEPPPW